MLVVTMNSIRAFNVRSRIGENSGRYPNPEPDTGAPTPSTAPLKPTDPPVANDAADTSSSSDESTP
jgi:hypothetical protein